MFSPIVVFVMASSPEEALSIGKTLVEEKLAACTNIVESIRSFYIWQGNFCDDNEVLLIIKSCQEVLDRLIHRVKEIHSYDVPEIIALPIIGGSEDYVHWMEDLLT